MLKMGEVDKKEPTSMLRKGHEQAQDLKPDSKSIYLCLSGPFQYALRQITYHLWKFSSYKTYKQ